MLISPHLWHQGEGGDGGELGDDEAEDEAGAGPGAVTAHHHRVLVPGGPGQTPQVTLQTQELKQEGLGLFSMVIFLDARNNKQFCVLCPVSLTCRVWKWCLDVMVANIWIPTGGGALLC